MAKFGTTKVCQIMPRYLKAVSLGVIVSALGLQLPCDAQQPPGNKSNHPSNHAGAVRNHSNRSKARRKQQPIWEFCTKFGRGYLGTGAQFSLHHISPLQMSHVPHPPPPPGDHVFQPLATAFATALEMVLPIKRCPGVVVPDRRVDSLILHPEAGVRLACALKATNGCWTSRTGRLV